MSEASKAAREAMKRKAKSMAEGGPNTRVDASSWEPSQTFDPKKKLGKAPVNPREYKRGGKVVEHMSGEPRSEKHAGKMARHPTHGCRIGNKEGNYEGGTRPTGGRIAKAGGGDVDDDKKPNLLKTAGSLVGGGLVPGAIASLLNKGGRVARKHGGKTSKGKTNINIIIGGGGREAAPPAPPQPGPIHPPGMFPPGGMQPGAAPPMPMPPPGPGGMAGMMPRKSGGRTYKSMDAGAGSGVGRLEKIGKTP